MKAALYGWTDYPIAELGDAPGIEAPVRPCKVVRYDGDKYVDIEVKGKLVSVKRGYVYRKPSRWYYGVPTFSFKQLDDLQGNFNHITTKG